MKDEIITSKHDFGQLNIRKEGIIQLQSEKDHFLLDDYRSLCSAIGRISNGNLMPYLVDERGRQRYMDGESKKYVSDNIHKYVSAYAIIEDSNAMSFMMSTFIQMYRPRVPMKIFKTEEEACAWLETFIVIV